MTYEATLLHILTPHISGTTFSPHFQREMLNIFRENTRRFVAGEPLLNVIPPPRRPPVKTSFIASKILRLRG
jgi:phosphoglycerate dehydrogenase-like enzyme